MKLNDLFSFCERGDIDAVQSFLYVRPDAVNAKHKNGETALHVAVAAGHIAIAEILLAKGADPNAQDKDGWVPLHRAALKVREDGLAMAQLLLAHGGNPRPRKADGITPLHFAAEVGNDALVSFLIDKGADPNEKDEWDGSTALHVAAANGQDEAVKVLLRRGARANALNDNFVTPLQMAEKYGRNQTADLLFRYGGGGWDDLERLIGRK